MEMKWSHESDQLLFKPILKEVKIMEFLTESQELETEWKDMKWLLYLICFAVCCYLLCLASQLTSKHIRAFWATQNLAQLIVKMLEAGSLWVPGEKGCE